MEKDGEMSLIIEILEMPHNQEELDLGIRCIIKPIVYCIWLRFHLTEIQDQPAHSLFIHSESSPLLRSYGDVHERKDATFSWIDAEAYDGVDLKMCLLRFQEIKTDILICLNRQDSRDLAGFLDIVQSFCVKDWSIIG